MKNLDSLTELITKAQQGDKETFHIIIVRFDRLIKKYAYQRHLLVMSEEAYAEGLLALTEGVLTYNANLGIPPEGYFESKVKYRLWNIFKKEKKLWQHQSSLENNLGDGEEGFTLQDTLKAAINIEEDFVHNETISLILKAIKELPLKQQYVITATLIQGHKLNQAAQNLNISTQAVQQLRERAIKTLKNKIIS